MKVVIDLNSISDKPMLPRLLLWKGAVDELWQIDFFTTDGFSSGIRVSPMRGTLSRQLQTEELLLLGSISVHGFRATNLSREPARHRSLSARQSDQALSPRHTRSGFAQHAGPRQLDSRLAYLRRFCPSIDQASARTLSQRRLRSSSGANCLCAGRDHYRSVFVAVPLGLLSQ